MEGERTSLLTRLPELVRDSRLEASLSSEGSIIHLHHDRPGRRARPRQERWTVTRRLGRGSYGIVSLIEAEQQGATTFRAVKRITYQSPTSVAYYQHELETLAKFSNPRVTRVSFVLSRKTFSTKWSLYSLYGALFNPLAGSRQTNRSISKWNTVNSEISKIISVRTGSCKSLKRRKSLDKSRKDYGSCTARVLPIETSIQKYNSI